MRSSAALLLFAVVACSRHPTPAAPAPPPPESSAEAPPPVQNQEPASPEEVAAAVGVARKFWEAIIAQNDHALDGLVAFPFMWDSRCRIFPARAEMDAHLKTQERPPGVRIGDVRSIPTTGVIEELHEALDNLSAVDGCPSDMAAMQADAARMKRIYVLVDLVMAKQTISMVTRVSRPSGDASAGWRVTGLDN